VIHPWLYRAKVLHRVFEMKGEMTIFLSDSNNNFVALCYNEDFIQELAYFVDFLKISNLDK
jgi:hypothetical protein